MSSPPGSSPAPAPLPTSELPRLARDLGTDEYRLFSETCRRDSFCLSCNQAFCSHCCIYHHVHHYLGTNMVVKIDLDAGGRPVFPTHTAEGHKIKRCMVEMISAADYTSRHARDAFCLFCRKAFCSHHDHRARGLPDAVVHVDELDGRHRTGTECPWWASRILGRGPRSPRRFKSPARAGAAASAFIGISPRRALGPGSN